MTWIQRTRDTRGVLPALVVLAFLAIWEGSVVFFNVRPFVLPRPSAVAVALVVEAPVLLVSALATGQAILAGFVIAVLVGVPLACILVSSNVIERSLFPLLLGAQLVPKVALAPVLTVWLGLGPSTKITVAFLLSFFPILIDTMIGLKSVEPGKIQVARSMGASVTRMFLKIKLPSALPSMFSGMKVASTLAVVGALVGEFIGARAGLGDVLIVSNSNFDTVTMFAAITYLTALGVLLYAAIHALETLVIPWHVSQRPSLDARVP